MDALTAIGLVVGIMRYAYSAYKTIQRIYGKEKIPEWNELMNENAMLQAEIDAEKAKG